MAVDLDLGYDGIAGQFRRSKIKVKCEKYCFLSLLCCFRVNVEVKVKGHGQIPGAQQSVLGAWVV